MESKRESKTRSKTWTRRLLAVLLLLTGCRPARQYPDRPIALICPWSAGGGTDRVSRQVAVMLERELGAPVNVVNATGGGGVTGHTRGAIARADGYTLTMATCELNMLHWRGLTSISYKDYQPLMLINRDDAAVFVRADSQRKTLADLEQAIRSTPRTLKASGTAQGGIWHVALAGWLHKIGLRPDDVVWVSINGAAPSLQELIAGGVDVVSCSLPEAQALLDAGRVRCLGLMSPQRLAAFPDVPTFGELGQDWAMGTWRGLALPRGVPQDRLDRLAEAVRRIVTSDEYLDFMRAAGFNPAAEPLDQFGETLARLDDQFGAILTSEAFRSVRTTRFGPMLFPTILGGLLALSLVGLLATGGLRRTEGLARITRDGLVRVALVVAWVLLYLALAEWVGFILTAAVLLFALMWRLDARLSVAAVVTVVLVPAAYQLFAVCLRVPLPWGWLGW